jgi:shikimate dehydrogenase
VLNPGATHLAVWGDPIDHSRSPLLHGAAYAALGLDWTYERRRVTEGEFASTLAGLDATWRGLSVTYPLKSAALRASTSIDDRARMTGAVNTLLLAGGTVQGFNTDVGGITASLAENGVATPSRGRIVGAGATATSALLALAELGASDVEVVARRPDAVDPLAALGDVLGVRVTTASFDSSFVPADVTIATLPGGADVPDAAADALAATGGFLLDVVYGHWPTTLAAAWERRGAPVTDGLGMLLHQALLQVRVFVSEHVERPLAGEESVLAEMRRSVMGD